MDRPPEPSSHVTGLADRLRAAGCVFAEEEAGILIERAGSDDTLLEELVSRREAGAPLEPLVGWVDFGGLRLAVGPGVFVPRQRTLALASRAVAELRSITQDRGGATVFVEAFSGVAPLAAHVRAALPEVDVYACELDAEARAYATRNLDGVGMTPGAVYAADVLEGLSEDLHGRIDVIAAVPPYVPEAELELMPREAREHEPEAALLGGADGLHWVRALIEQASGWISSGGVLLLELAGSQVAAAVEHGARYGFVAEQENPAALSTVVLRLSIS